MSRRAGLETTIRRTSATLAVALAGGLAANWLGLPAGLLMGAVIATSIAAVAGMPATIPVGLRNVCFVLIGMALGTNVASDTLDLLPQWPVTLAALGIGLVVMVWGTGLLLNRLFALDRGTAYLSAFPGHLSFVLAIAEAGYGDPRQIAMIQSIRVLVLTISVPLFVAIAGPELMAEVAPRASVEPGTLVLLTVACVAGGVALHALRTPAAYVLGPMFVAIAGKLGGVYEGVLPPPIMWLTFVVMGGVIGSRFANVGLDVLRRAALGGVVVSVMALVVTTATALASSAFVDMPLGQIWLGFAPGGLEVMGALGIAFGYDTGFIAAHHTARLLVMSIAIPLVAAAARGRGTPPTRPVSADRFSGGGGRQ